jgi:protease II
VEYGQVEGKSERKGKRGKRLLRTNDVTASTLHQQKNKRARSDRYFQLATATVCTYERLVIISESRRARERSAMEKKKRQVSVGLS